MVDDIERIKGQRKSNKEHFESTLKQLEGEKVQMERDYDRKLREMERAHTVEVEKRTQDYNDKMEADKKRF